MKVNILNIAYDHRIKAFVATAATTYRWYIDALQIAESNLEIQRDIIRSKKAYQTLRADLRKGCILPPIVLAAHDVDVPFDLNAQAPDIITPAQLAVLAENVSASDKINLQIIDGLQRTNALFQTLADIEDGNEKEIFLDRPLRLEFWLNISFFSLAYRMLLLNAGQKPMSMKHQLEILAGNMANELKSVPGIDIIKTFDKRRRVHAGQFQLAKLAQAFQAWLQGQPSVDTQNLIAEQLLADNAVEVLGEDLSKGISVNDDRIDFKEFVSWIVRVDQFIGDDNIHFFGNETVLQGLAAAAGRAHRTESLGSRLIDALNTIETALHAQPDEDILGIQRFEAFRRGIDPKRRNVGEATRDLVFRAFQEFVFNGGTKDMAECWTFAASAS